MNLWDLYEEWVIAAQAEGFSVETIRSKHGHLQRFNRYLERQEQPTTTEAVTPRILREFVADSRETYAPETVRGNVRVLKTLFRFGVREGLIDSDPTARVPVPKVPQTDYEVLEPDDIETLLRACDLKTYLGVRDYAVVLVLYDSGIRASELTGLRDEDIDYERGLLSVFGKGAKDRRVPVSSRTLRAIRRYQHKRNARFTDTPRLFLNHRGADLTRSGLLQLLKTLGERTGLEVYTHQLRHSFAVESLRNGAREFDIQDCLGHASLQTTRVYARQSAVQLREQHQRFSPANRLRIRV